MVIERTAQCHCGSLRVIATGEPEYVYVCHCLACQRRTGAVLHSGASYLKRNVRIEGVTRVFARDINGIRQLRFHFCADCGSNVYYEGERNPDRYGICVGAFADPNFPTPTFSIWEESMHSWLMLPAGSEHFARGLPPADT